jgi:hypothetical protein
MDMKVLGRIGIAILLVLLLCTMTAAAVSVADRNIILNVHNGYRSTVGIQPLTWSTALETSAQNWANKLRPGMDPHSHTGGLGENVAWANYNMGWNGAVNSWGKEKNGGTINGIPNVPPYTIQKYILGTTYAGQHGHYTQMVWSNTKQVGCGNANYQGTNYYVCQYSPPGNINGQYPYFSVRSIPQHKYCYTNGRVRFC